MKHTTTVLIPLNEVSDGHKSMISDNPVVKFKPSKYQPELLEFVARIIAAVQDTSTERLAHDFGIKKQSMQAHVDKRRLRREGDKA